MNDSQYIAIVIIALIIALCGMFTIALKDIQEKRNSSNNFEDYEIDFDKQITHDELVILVRLLLINLANSNKVTLTKSALEHFPILKNIIKDNNGNKK